MWSGFSQDCDPSPGNGGIPSVLCLGHRGFFLLLHLGHMAAPHFFPCIGYEATPRFLVLATEAVLLSFVIAMEATSRFLVSGSVAAPCSLSHLGH